VHTISLPATSEGVARVAHEVAELGAAAGLPPARTYKLRLAAEEIATNIVDHGFGRAPRDPVPDFRMEWDCDEEWVRVHLVDTAGAFDPTAAPAPTDLDAPLEERRMGGLGIHLVRASVDEFRYERRGQRNRVTLGLRRCRVGRAV
jgi:serine/threonine-protein kinase RsbW